MRGRDLSPWRRRSFFPAVFEFDVESFLDNFFDSIYPQAIRIDMRETESEYIVEADMPGYDKNSIEIRYENNLLTISGQQDEFTEEKRDNYIHRERRRGSFRRTIPVPENVDAEKIKASYNNGVLRVILPKITPSKPTGRRIEIE
ncbi:Hsp20/alpha crystallin family protein [Thermosediminibacter litoriperuensis]|uniref:HSP20 family protein n=1 Tax=Thermosediminibacter litoriperuensis TaxID=291989 RepID=A0A5S5APA6_9FIRM|nr:Hsp20/alpha crystallin family protein [Thermosediminibacter litoriperuensis]TYP53301.1 HSP20 family protein [Thermosediminibacter litoriperuensis]